jgi:predicted enzyme related to lactoylglutathione lyase
MDWKLEVVQIPVSDVDRAKHFYSEQVGFLVDLDTQISDEIRLVQLTPPGSACSIHLSSGILNMTPGVLEGLQIVVSDIEAARSELAERGVEASPVQHLEGRQWVEGEGEGGTRSSSSATLMATAGFCRSDPLTAPRPRGLEGHEKPGTVHPRRR